jgi:polyhydroxybutyrate depolymerase
MPRKTRLALVLLVCSIFAAFLWGCNDKKKKYYYPPPTGTGTGTSTGTDTGTGTGTGTSTGTGTVTIVPGVHYDSIMHGGLERTFIFYVPASCTFSDEQPLLFVLHGTYGSGEGIMADLTLGSINDLSENEGFIVVYPDGLENVWNDGRGIQKYRSHRENIDDVGLISDLVDHFEDELNIDENRVYSTGFSNGGFMSLRLAIELSDRIAAVAPVVATMSENLSLLTPVKPVPLIMILGTDDPIVPWDGGFLGSFGVTDMGKAISADDSVDYWVTHNGCSPTPEITWLPDTDPDDGTLVRREEYSGGTDIEVILYAVKGGGHTWPDGKQYLPEFLIGKTCRDMDATEVIWNFFKNHQLE